MSSLVTSNIFLYNKPLFMLDVVVALDVIISLDWMCYMVVSRNLSMNNFSGQITPSSIFNTSSNKSKHYWICHKTISSIAFPIWLYFQVLCNVCKFMMLNIYVFKLMLNRNEQCDFQMVSNAMMCGHHNRQLNIECVGLVYWISYIQKSMKLSPWHSVSKWNYIYYIAYNTHDDLSFYVCYLLANCFETTLWPN